MRDVIHPEDADAALRQREVRLVTDVEEAADPRLGHLEAEVVGVNRVGLPRLSWTWERHEQIGLGRVVGCAIRWSL